MLSFVQHDANSSVTLNTIQIIYLVAMLQDHETIPFQKTLGLQWSHWGFYSQKRTLVPCYRGGNSTDCAKNWYVKTVLLSLVVQGEVILDLARHNVDPLIIVLTMVQRLDLHVFASSLRQKPKNILIFVVGDFHKRLYFRGRNKRETFFWYE